jgi:hypothetical protein
MNIQEYCDTLNIEIRLIYYPNQKGRWSASFYNCEFKDKAGSACLESTHGNGTTPQSAMYDFIKRIRGKLLVYCAMHKDKRMEFVVPDSLTLMPE